MLRALAYAGSILLFVLYFFWLIAQMSRQANGGAAVPEVTFGAVALGVLAGAAAFLHRPGH